MMVPKLITAAVADLLPSSDNPRIVSEDPAELNSDGLLDSVRAIGVQQPLQVRDHPTEPGKKEILAGERRWMCCRVAGTETVMALDYGVMPDDEAFRITCIENACRQELKPLEQGRAASIALARCRGDVQAAAALLGQTPRWIAMGAKIHEGLAEVWKEGLLRNEALRHWTAGHVALIARFPENVQRDLYDSIAKVRWRAERVSVDELGRQTADLLRVLAKAPFDTADCENCPKRSGRQHLLWADEESEATGKNERCLDAKCWQEKETQACRRAFSEKAKDYKGLVAVDLSKQHDYQREQDLKQVYGDNLLVAGPYGVPKFELVKAETRGAIPALVVAGTGKGAVKYIKRIKAECSTSPKVSKAEKQAAKRKKRIWGEFRRLLRESFDRIEVAQILDGPMWLSGVLFSVVLEGCPGIPAWGEERDEFLREFASQTGPDGLLRWLWERLWGQVKEVLCDNACLGSGSPTQDEERDLRAITEAFGWDYDELMAAAETKLAREDQIADRTERVTVAVPKSLDASCELRLYEEAGTWYGGFAVEIPKAGVDLPVDTIGDAYESKALAVQAMAGAAAKWLAERKKEKKCPASLYKPLATAISEVVGACELELRRSGQGSDELPVAGDVPIAKPSGLIEGTEKIRVPMEKGWQAAITIQVAQVEGLWYAGWDAHVPRAGDCMPCSTAHQGYAGRNEALGIASERLKTWLAGKPGRKGYRYYDAVQGAVLEACRAAANPSGTACDGNRDLCPGCKQPAKTAMES